MYLDGIETTRDVKIPTNPLDRIIGQEHAILKVRSAIRQRRNLLLVGPPGIGKSMIAQALALNLPKPTQEIRVLHNPQNPERPLLEIVTRDKIEREIREQQVAGVLVSPKEVPSFVAEQLGFRCSSCGEISNANESICPKCGSNKYSRVVWNRRTSPFGDIITEVFEIGVRRPEAEVKTTKIRDDGTEAVLIYQNAGNGKIRVLDQSAIERIKKIKEKKQMKVLVPLERIPFVQATGASETELLGDVRHDPYGSHPEIGIPAYKRVIPGAIHEAHEGVLFIDELPQLEYLQNFILTAMQEKKFSIVGRNPHSAGAAVKVKDVPCDFIFVGACNIKDLGRILPPLRSRIIGNGYEILLETTMPDTEENRKKFVQFIAQEIEIDGRIPHADRGAIDEIIKEAKKRALEIDGVRNALTLRLRDMGGLIRLAGDLAKLEGSEFIERRHIRESIKDSKPIEHQIREKYGSVWMGMEKDNAVPLRSKGGGEGYV
ncbi:MAG: Lon protease family protein [Candidatus Altiarchaeales archaeon]|nr:MAG: Lon protease family protein [Candidatus Altiarchaeales archaeon]RLI94283.1 MAG: Lon protease family protein [Candidatus Altiarchaeales archaeon]RLI94953.1 MAG: Lon protease family protein [Candidatus Altiarchaeales archaeon]HDO82335.1 Lon protease family protein [Candidatus Altiarchaeales archaeon]HEX54984.1 Lon protease family protein [Candidatus Altiarchaeales archaeon]